LTSRRQVEAELANGPVPVTVLRAAMIIGSGSASFEILRYLVERLPCMITPRWVRTECQPIAVADVLHYVVTCLDEPATAGRTLDIGGPDVVTYLDLMRTTARICGLPRRLVIPVPLLTPRLSSLWIHLVTPISARIARPLAEGLRNRVVCREQSARELMPQRLTPVEEAIALALGRHQAGRVETSWSDAGVIPGDPDWAGGTVFTDPRSITVQATPKNVFKAVCRVGGGHGWYFADWLWRLRGLLDKLIGGPGLRRGRRDPEQVAYGDALDFWRVTAGDPDRPTCACCSRRPASNPGACSGCRTGTRCCPCTASCSGACCAVSAGLRRRWSRRQLAPPKASAAPKSLLQTSIRLIAAPRCIRRRTSSETKRMRRSRTLLLLATAVAGIGLTLQSCSTTYQRRDPTGEVFPAVRGKALDGAEVELPSVGAGAPLLLLVGFVQDAQFDIDRWLLGLAQAGVKVRTYEVPTIPGLMPRMFQGAIDGGMRRGIPAEDWSGVVTLYGDGHAVARFTGNQDGLTGRVVLLDSTGKVVFFHDRGYSVGTLDRLRAALATLRKAPGDWDR
jgi:hypothetical protein